MGSWMSSLGGGAAAEGAGSAAAQGAATSAATSSHPVAPTEVKSKSFGDYAKQGAEYFQDAKKYAPGGSVQSGPVASAGEITTEQQPGQSENYQQLMEYLQKGAN